MYNSRMFTWSITSLIKSHCLIASKLVLMWSPWIIANFSTYYIQMSSTCTLTLYYIDFSRRMQTWSLNYRRNRFSGLLRFWFILIVYLIVKTFYGSRNGRMSIHRFLVEFWMLTIFIFCWVACDSLLVLIKF